MAQVLTTDTAGAFAKAAERASELLKAGEVVALPTETVYGLAANAFNASAVAKIFSLKKRPPGNPLIVHVASMALIHECVAEFNQLATDLAAAFWPGPLTLVLPKSNQIPGIVTAEGGTVGIRWPSHPFILEVIRICGFPLAAPSANLANAISPTTAEHVAATLGSVLPLIVDGGASNVGIESTVVDVTGGVPIILRPGIISANSIEAATGKAPLLSKSAKGILRSPGQLKRHYSPKSRTIILKWANKEQLFEQLRDLGEKPERTAVLAYSQIPLDSQFLLVSVIPHDPIAYARALYAELHRADELAPNVIICEEVPQNHEWEGINDRLNRASSG